MSFMPEQENGQEWMLADEAGSTILPISSIISISITAGGSVVSDSIEEGSFTSYNKTSEPLEISMEFAFQGEKGALQEALTKLDELKNEVATFSIVTPYREYENMTLENYNHNMSLDNGLGVLAIQGTFKEIRETEPAYAQVDASTIQANQQVATISSDDCSNASDSSVVDGGQVGGYEPSEGDEGSAAQEDNRSVLKAIGDSGSSIIEAAGGMFS